MTRRRSSRVAPLSLGLAVLLAPAVASAYCRTSSCAEKKGAWQVCTPAAADDCGIELFWRKQCVGFTLQKDASSQVSLSQAETTFTAAFKAWTNADCGSGAHPSIAIEYLGPVTCDEQEYNKVKGNANVIMFRDASWPYEGTANVLALTTVTYNLETGEIYDADMELNSADNDNFTVGDATPAQMDLLSIATHETGHFLGMAHSPLGDATMFSDYQVGSKDLRTLTDDDIAGICAIYPPGQPKSDTCDTEPRHGFSEDCGVDQPEPSQGGCTCATPADEPGRGALSGLAAALGLGALLSRRRRSGRAS